MQAKHDQWLGFWREELETAFLYDRMAGNEKNARLCELYQRMATMERRHAMSWAEQLRKNGVAVPAFKPSWRIRILAAVATRFGNRTVIDALNATENDAGKTYAAQEQPEAQAMAGEERAHARSFQMLATEASYAVGQPEARHKNAGGNALRAGVMGANDGLVSNFCLVMGMAGATEAAGAGESRVLLMTGIAGLLAGAISMALGEWLSVQSSRELYERQINLEKDEIEANPQEEKEELSLIYQAKGMNAEEADRLAEKIAANPAGLLDTLSREELGIDPEELGGSAWEAAGTSFLLFAIGAIIPVIPFFFLPQNTASLGISAALSMIGLFGLGAATTLMTGKSVWLSGLRQAVFGIVASVITFAIGQVIGVNLG